MTIRARRLLGLSVLLLTSACAATTSPKAAKHATKDAAAPRLLWRDPGPIAQRDLAWSDRNVFRRPVAPFTFVRENLNDTRAKVEVTDAEGAKWNVKLEGNWDDSAEVHAEVAAGRLTWALGYFLQKSYFVDAATIQGINRPLTRASRGLTPDGHFRGARFEERSSDETSADERWSLTRNPFVGTRELAGLEILMTMVNNWDLGGDANFKVLRVKEGKGSEELHYIISDFGASFGRMARQYLPFSLLEGRQWSKWNVKDYEQQPFIDGVHDGRLYLHFKGYGGIQSVPLDQARWFSGLVSQLSDQQIRTAFMQAGATADEVEGFSKRFEQKVGELGKAVGSQ